MEDFNNRKDRSEREEGCLSRQCEISTKGTPSLRRTAPLYRWRMYGTINADRQPGTLLMYFLFIFSVHDADGDAYLH